MNKKTLMAAIIALSLLIPFSAETRAVNAQFSQAITIEADGSVNPPSATIQKDGYVYTLTADFDGSIIIERGSVVFDGAGHTLQGPVQGPVSTQSGYGLNIIANNVTIRNIRATDWKAGIIGTYSNNTITNCELTQNYQALAIFAEDYILSGNNISENLYAFHVKGGATRPSGDNNLIMQNQIFNNYVAFEIYTSNGTTIKENDVENNTIIVFWETALDGEYTFLYHNNFINNIESLRIAQLSLVGPVTISPAGRWDNGRVGNYWSDYLSRYPNANEKDNSGIYSEPYELNVPGGNSGAAFLGTATDRYPLVSPINVTFSVGPSLSSTPTPTPVLPASPSPSQSTSPTPSPSPSPSPSETPSNSPSLTSTIEPSHSQSLPPTQEPTTSPNQHPELREAYYLVAIVVAFVIIVAVTLLLRKSVRKHR